ILLTARAADRRDAAEVIRRLVAIALLDLPQAVILPGQHVVRVGLQRALVPGLRQSVVAELAVGIADQIGDAGVVVVAERLELSDGTRIIVALVDGRVRRAIALPEGGIVGARLFGGLLLGFRTRLGFVRR